MTQAHIHLPHISDDDDDARIVTRFDVERLACGELSGDEAARVQAAVDADADLKAFFADVKASDAAFLIAQPARPFVDGIMARQPAPSLWRGLLKAFNAVRLQASLGALATAAVVAIVISGPADVASGPDGGASGPNAGGIRTKGGDAPALGFVVKVGDGARVGQAGEALRAGDHIQLTVKDAPRPVMVLVGVDGSGVVSVYATETDAAVRKGANAGQGSQRVLPAALVLDETTGAERFFVVYGDDVGATEAAARTGAAALADDVKRGKADLVQTTRLPLDKAFAQASVHIVKVP
jgi:hypothetical protein